MTKVRFFCSFPTTLTRCTPLGTLSRWERQNTSSPLGRKAGDEGLFKNLNIAPL